MSTINEICTALGLFDGARPVPVTDVIRKEILPAIEALKTNNPQAAVLITELQRSQRLWIEALTKLVDANRRADGFLQRWHDVEADRTSIRNAKREADATLQRVTALVETWRHLSDHSEIRGGSALRECADELARALDGEKA